MELREQHGEGRRKEPAVSLGGGGERSRVGAGKGG